MFAAIAIAKWCLRANDSQDSANSSISKWDFVHFATLWYGIVVVVVVVGMGLSDKSIAAMRDVPAAAILAE
ncbi:MAG: hypothetical protein K8L97_32085 [Anaerolineae bacterium]|nr:hypothetical protein [Anaerolineae bacterium]